MRSLRYDINRIAKVSTEDDGYELKFENKWCVWLKKKYGIKPEAGDMVEIYGDFGQTIQGICINGKTAFFKGEIQIDNEHKDWCVKNESKKKKSFVKRKNLLDKDYKSLPESFKKRINLFRGNNLNFRWEFESYEMSCCVDAVKIASECKTLDNLKKFQALPWKKQQKLIPNLFNGHSGNSFGMACRLAYWFITKPNYVWKEHGAMCPLVGCKKYGCFATTVNKKG